MAFDYERKKIDVLCCASARNGINFHYVKYSISMSTHTETKRNENGEMPTKVRCVRKANLRSKMVFARGKTSYSLIFAKRAHGNRSQQG